MAVGLSLSIWQLVVLYQYGSWSFFINMAVGRSLSIFLQITPILVAIPKETCD